MGSELNERGAYPSASNWKRYELCHGSWQLELQAVRLGQAAYQTQSLEAERGTRIHAWLAGEQIELIESERQTADFLAERTDEQIKRIFGDQPQCVLREKRLWLEVKGRRALSGQFDLVVHDESTALCIDFKTGYSEPDPAEQNAQLKVLAVLVAIALPTVKEVICQLISGPFGVTEKRFSILELGAAYNDIVGTLEQINSEYATFNPAPEICRYCPAVMICEAVNKIAATQYKVLPEGAGATAVLDECEILERRIKEIRAHYYSVLEAGQQIPGYCLQPGPSRREVSDWIAARRRLEDFISVEELDGLANYSIPSVEKLLTKSLKLKANQAGAKLAEILGDLLGVRSTNLVLKREVPTNGSRPKAIA